jgi:hypothetical protein
LFIYKKLGIPYNLDCLGGYVKWDPLDPDILNRPSYLYNEEIMQKRAHYSDKIVFDNTLLLEEIKQREENEANEVRLLKEKKDLENQLKEEHEKNERRLLIKKRRLKVEEVKQKRQLKSEENRQKFEQNSLVKLAADEEDKRILSLTASKVLI